MLDKEFIGKWQIVEMKRWDQNFINLIEIPHIEFHDAGFGTFYFGTICANIDYRINGDGKAEFSFYGDNDGQEVFGRGWAFLNDDILYGYLYFHEGEESGFKAEKEIFIKHQNMYFKRKNKSNCSMAKLNLFA